MKLFFHPILALSTLAVLAGAVAFLSNSANQPQPLAKALEDVHEVAGQPVTDVVTPKNVRSKAIAGELIVRFENPAAQAHYAGRIKESKLPGTFVISADTTRSLEQQAAELDAQPGIATALPNYVVRASLTPNDPGISNQWAVNKVAAPTAWDRTTGTSNIIIASIDTGVNHNHQDFAGRTWVNSGEIAGNGLDDDGNGYKDDVRGMDFVNGACTFTGDPANDVCTDDADGPMDDHGHGSLTSGVFGAATNNGVGLAGLDWSAKVMAVKVLDDSGSGSLYDVAAGIRYATMNGAKVINMSLGAFGLDSYSVSDDELENAYNRGSVLVAASGNDGSSTDIDYPGAHPRVIAVGATNSSDVRASFSNSAPQVSVVAPGVSVYSVSAVDNNGAPVNSGYAFYSGTSLSTPHVSGVAALLVSLQPNLSPAQVRQILENTADKPSGMGGANFTNQYGYGRVNATRALGALPAWSSQYVGSSGYPTLGAGEQATLYIDYKNTGSSNWSRTGNNPIRLATIGPRDRISNLWSTSWLNGNRPASFKGIVEEDGSVTDTDTVMTGETARFEFKVTAPPLGFQHTYHERFQLVVEGVTWLEDYGAFWDVTVQPRTYSYGFAGAAFPPDTMQNGQRATVSLDLANTGTATWRRDSFNPLRLGTSRGRDRLSRFANDSWDSPNRVRFDGKVVSGTLSDSDSVAPGETARFTFDMTAPNIGGTFNEFFEPVVEGWSWMGDIGMYFQVWVPDPNAPAYDFQYINASPWPSLNRGETTELTLDIRNTGSSTWDSDGATPMRLATIRPTDRTSAFYTANAGWVSSNRVHLGHNLSDPTKDIGGETTVAPGEIGRFRFTITAPAAPGVYNEYFNPVIDGVAHLRDIGVFWKVGVRSPVKVGLGAQSSATFTYNAAVILRSESGNLHATVPGGTSITLSNSGVLYTATAGAGVYNDTSPIRAEPVDPSSVATVSNLADNGSFNQFRSVLVIKNGTPGTFLVNEINMEDYVKGLAEVPDSWPQEAIKAQVVAARTYAYKRVLSPPNNVFNVYDDTRSQVYNGYLNEVAKPNHSLAANQTYGQAMYYGGSVIDAYYSSDSGGQTASNEDAWGGSPIAYLRSVADPYEKPDVWNLTVSDATIGAAYGVSGSITGMTVTEWYPSLRPKTLRLTSTGSGITNHTLPADTHRSRMGARSSRWTNFTRSGSNWIISGRGFGHGIGMGQWGAYNQGLAGRNHVQILVFYYQGIAIGSIYN